MEHPEHLYAEATERIVAQVEAIPDPIDRIRKVNDLIAQGGLFHGRLAQVTREAVREMREQGMSHGDVAKALGVTRARAQQLAEGQG